MKGGEKEKEASEVSNSPSSAESEELPAMSPWSLGPWHPSCAASRLGGMKSHAAEWSKKVLCGLPLKLHEHLRNFILVSGQAEMMVNVSVLVVREIPEPSSARRQFTRAEDLLYSLMEIFNLAHRG
ncbi:uncharacterized protein VSU04_013516 isoform 1-T2 [Chlamydotis macqueenii]